MSIYQQKAMDTIEHLTDWLEIPCEFLVGSRILVSGGITKEEMIYYEALHDGTKWEIISESEVICLTNGCSPRPMEFLHLGEPAIQWLARSITTYKVGENDGSE